MKRRTFTTGAAAALLSTGSITMAHDIEERIIRALEEIAGELRRLRQDLGRRDTKVEALEALGASISEMSTRPAGNSVEIEARHIAYLELDRIRDRLRISFALKAQTDAG